MRVARAAQAPVLLVGDIDRGGVFASLVGTLELLPSEERALVRGFIINKFRGDLSLLEPGLRFLEERTGVPVMGVVPYFTDIHLPEEDSVALEGRVRSSPAVAQDLLDLAVLRLPRISNFDDFDLLEQEAGVHLRYVARADQLGKPDLVLIPGTKSTVSDLIHLRESGLAERVLALAKAGTPVIGICGGYQMLGSRILDPHHVESDQEEVGGRGIDRQSQCRKLTGEVGFRLPYAATRALQMGIVSERGQAGGLGQGIGAPGRTHSAKGVNDPLVGQAVSQAEPRQGVVLGHGTQQEEIARPDQVHGRLGIGHKGQVGLVYHQEARPAGGQQSLQLTSAQVEASGIVGVAQGHQLGPLPCDVRTHRVDIELEATLRLSDLERDVRPSDAARALVLAKCGAYDEDAVSWIQVGQGQQPDELHGAVADEDAGGAEVEMARESLP